MATDKQLEQVNAIAASNIGASHIAYVVLPSSGSDFYATFATLDERWLVAASNLGDISTASTARSNLGIEDSALSPASQFVSASGDTMTGLLGFSGSAHAGLHLNNLTTAQRDALTASDGMFVYNTSSSQFQGHSGSWGEIGGGGGAASLVLDTLVNIFATTACAGDIAYSTDTNEFLLHTASAWQRSSTPWNEETGEPDMGPTVESGMVQNDRAGYGTDYITDKTLYNVQLLGHPDTPTNGALRVNIDEDPDKIQVYLRDEWQSILYDLTNSDGYFAHTPLNTQVKVWSGLSASAGLNGRPVINEYVTDMGANPAPRYIDGGSF